MQDARPRMQVPRLERRLRALQRDSKLVRDRELVREHIKQLHVLLQLTLAGRWDLVELEGLRSLDQGNLVLQVVPGLLQAFLRRLLERIDNLLQANRYTRQSNGDPGPRNGSNFPN